MHRETAAKRMTERSRAGPRSPAVEVNPAMLRRLLVRPVRLDHEHRAGHWLRVAHANGITNPSWLLDISERRVLSLVRVCPQCLSKKGAVWQQGWANSTRPFCEQHGLWLVDKCQGCGQLLRWSKVRYLACGCGQDLRELPVRRLSAEIRRALVLDSEPPAALLWLGSLSLYGLRMKPLKKASRHTMADVIELNEAGARVAVDWPKAFFDMLDACRLDENGPGSLCLLNDALPGLTRLVGRLRDAAWRARIASALGAYASLSRHTPSPIAGKNVPGGRHATMSGIARQLGVRTERLVAELDRLPGVAVATRITAGGRRRRMVGAAAIEDVRLVILDEISIKQAAKLCGLSAARIRQLIGDERLVTRACRLSRAAVGDLRCILMASGNETPQPIEPVTLGHALRCCIPVEQTTRFIDAIINGDLTVHATPKTRMPTQLLADMSQVKAWAARQSSAGRNWLTIPKCAERLGLKQQVAYHLVQAGLIVSQLIKANGRSVRVMTSAAVREFEATIEPLARLAARAGVDHRRALKWAEASGLELVSGPTVDGGRQYFVRLSSPPATCGPNDGQPVA